MRGIHYNCVVGGGMMLMHVGALQLRVIPLGLKAPCIRERKHLSLFNLIFFHHDKTR
jgi:hypothetical protein